MAYDDSKALEDPYILPFCARETDHQWRRHCMPQSSEFTAYYSQVDHTADYKYTPQQVEGEYFQIFLFL